MNVVRLTSDYLLHVVLPLQKTTLCGMGADSAEMLMSWSGGACSTCLERVTRLQSLLDGSQAMKWVLA